MLKRDCKNRNCQNASTASYPSHFWREVIKCHAHDVPIRHLASHKKTLKVSTFKESFLGEVSPKLEGVG